MILVDDIRGYETHLRCKSWCHMVSTESEEELHAFAAKLGLRREWAQLRPKASAAHYDLVPSKRALAIKLGAISVTSRELVLKNFDGITRRGLWKPPPTTPTLVVNRQIELFDVYIGRPSKWGNPFTHAPSTTYREVTIVATREQAIECYRKWIQTQTHLLAALGELKGRRLGCWCSPKPCHGEVLAELADALP